MAEFLEGYAVECFRCHARRDLLPDERPLLAHSAPVTDMPRWLCGGALPHNPLPLKHF